jgi:hypothetical protein
MDNTAPTRQAAYRKRLREKGYRFVQGWVDADGFSVKGYPGKDGKKTGLTLNQLLEELTRVTAGVDEAFTARLYGELASYAGGVRELWDMVQKSSDLFSETKEKNKSPQNQRDLF